MKLFNFLILLTFSSTAYTASKTTSEIGFETRFFEKQDNSPARSSNQSLYTKFSHKYKNGKYRFYGEFTSMQDLQDENRKFIRPLELWAGIKTDKYIFKAGYQIFNWSSTEAFHPADMINSRNLDSNLRNLSKFGELAISLKTLFSDSSLIAFILPKFEAPHFAQETSSYGLGLRINKPQIIRDSTKVAENDNWVWQGGFQFNTRFYDNDLSFFYVNHINRNFGIDPLTFNPLSGQLDPLFSPIEHIGFTSQSVILNWLFKTEFSYENIPSELYSSGIDDHSILAIGVERTYGLESGSEVTILLEAQKYFSATDSFLLNIPFQNDTLLGFRYALNDANSSEFFFSVIADNQFFDQFLYNFSYSQRIGNSWKLETGIHYIDAENNNLNAGLAALDNSDHIFFNLYKYF